MPAPSQPTGDIAWARSATLCRDKGTSQPRAASQLCPPAGIPDTPRTHRLHFGGVVQLEASDDAACLQQRARPLDVVHPTCLLHRQRHDDLHHLCKEGAKCKFTHHHPAAKGFDPRAPGVRSPRSLHTRSLRRGARHPPPCTAAASPRRVSAAPSGPSPSRSRTFCCRW